MTESESTDTMDILVCKRGNDPVLSTASLGYRTGRRWRIADVDMVDSCEHPEQAGGGINQDVAVSYTHLDVYKRQFIYTRYRTGPRTDP